MARREIFSGNWKMYKTYNDAIDLVNGIISGAGEIGSKEIIVFPPATGKLPPGRKSFCKSTIISASPDRSLVFILMEFIYMAYPKVIQLRYGAAATVACTR